MRHVMGAVLAGGQSTRMGQDKAEVVLGGQTMVRWVATAMSEVFDRTVVVGRDASVDGLDTIPDTGESHRGPLSGLVSALATLDRPIVMVAVDQPLIRSTTLGELASFAGSGKTAVCIDDVPQITCAAYTPEILETASAHLDAGGSLRTLLDLIAVVRIEPGEWRGWGEDGRSWYSMDSQDDIVEAERRFRLNLLG